MKGHFLTQVFNPFLLKIGYFNTNNFILKNCTVFTVFFLAVSVASAQNYSNIEFIENKGQWDSRVKYQGSVSNGTFYLRESGFTIVQHNAGDMANLKNYIHDRPAGSSITVRSHAYNVDFVGASRSVKSIPDKAIPTYNNYFIGNDPSKWGSECHIYQAVTLKEVYPNVDVRYYTDNGFLKYDIIVNPGGDISKIALKYEGIDKLEVKSKGLRLSTSVGELKESAPYTYQSGAAGREEITCKYVIKNNVVRFDVKEYDRSAPLIIDPFIEFCSFSGSSADNWGYTATYGPDGSMYGGGIVFSPGFPVSPGAYQSTYGGGSGANDDLPIDMGIIRLSANGSQRIYATYLGGNGNEQPHSLVVDNQGNLVIAGRSNSSNYPVINNGSAASGGSDYDIVVTKLKADGTGPLIGSRKIGGGSDDGVNINPSRGGTVSLQRNYGDDGRSEVILDGAGNVYVASCTQSDNFPVTPGVFQPAPGGGQDGVVLKLNPNLSTILFASYLGGSANDAAYVLSLGAGGNIYVGGGTESGNMRGSTAGTVGPANHGLVDGFVSIINNNGTAISRTTYIGTSGYDQVFGIQFDLNGFPYIMGQTTGSWVVQNALYSNAGGKQFIAKLRPDLSAFVYSTAFGTGANTPNISPTAFLVDRCENVYISGWGGHYNNTNPYQSAGTAGLPVTANAIKSSTDGKDFYFFVLKKDAVSQLFGSFFGEQNSNRAGGDHVDGGTSRFDRNGVIYQAICANCNLDPPNRPLFPTTPGAWSVVNNGSGAGCNLAMLKISMNLSGVLGGVQSAIDGRPRDTAGCLPLIVDFSDTIGTAQSYEWYFNYVPGNPPDLVTTVPFATSPPYTAVGVYPVMLVAIDPTTCNVRDSSFTNIKVGDLKAVLAFDPVKLPPCTQFNYRFDNNSIPPPSRPFTATSFKWDFGDGTPLLTAGPAAVFHTYTGPGTYNVKLILDDDAYCNSPDTLPFRLSVAENVIAKFTTPATGCVKYNAVFTNTSVAGQTWLWDFGDSQTSTDFEPVHTYETAGTYNVTLTASNPNTCNLTSTTTPFTITVYDSPTPDFPPPAPPLVNTPTTFLNTSSPDAVRFKWDFGDGETLLTTSRLPVDHQYNATGTFTACLTAYNTIGCDSTFCRQVSALISPLMDLPNAFTPNSGDANSVVYVRGFGIAKIQFIIWNRWGQKVFETNNRLQGWDGKVKGVVQPMDVYAYTLSIEYFDGTKTTRKGDITLIR